MSTCKLDHSHEDVKKKYESQLPFLSEQMIPLFEQFFSKEHTQNVLNEMFHLLKKYDLASDEEKEERYKQMMLLLKNL
ncbi:group-specific protein [Bacillus sp. V3B]|uniref:group-specific protein n=1 Tax=Bacillus sp. V3B TaxID=2804915 RepID=UPI00210D8DD3|nr:group-specific protein [Bacillus sp. V3B]MCQ6276124.1 group-specific protein [Bacillus sp. V3B]